MSSFGGALLGVVLFLVSFPVLFMNEGRAVHMARDLEESEKSVIEIPADEVNSANEGKEVHFTAEAVSDETLTDTDFGVAAPKAIRLLRKAEMYQHKEDVKTETKKNLGGSETTEKTYTYPTGWYEDFQDSSTFKEQKPENLNPKKMPYTSQKWEAQKVTAGAFELSPSLVERIKTTKDLSVGGSKAEPKPEPKAEPNDKPKPDSNGEHKDDSKPEPKPKPAPKPAAGPKPPGAPADYEVVDGQFYKGEDPKNPEVGDVRVSYQVVEPMTVSVVSVQTGKSFKPFHGSSGNDIERLDEGKKSAAEMFKAANDENNMWTWILRAAGFVMMAFGIFLVGKPLSVLGDVVPFIGNMVGGVLAFFAAVIALPLALITISIAWVFYRPWIGVPLLAAGVGGVILVLWLLRKKKVPIERPA